MADDGSETETVMFCGQPGRSSKKQFVTQLCLCETMKKIVVLEKLFSYTRCETFKIKVKVKKLNYIL